MLSPEVLSIAPNYFSKKISQSLKESEEEVATDIKSEAWKKDWVVERGWA